MKEITVVLCASALIAHFAWARRSLGGFLGLMWNFVVVPISLGAVFLAWTDSLIWTLAGGWIVGVLIWMGLDRIKLGWILFPGASKGGEQVRRGTQIVSDEQATKWLGKEVLATCYARIGRVPVPDSVETTHFLMSGAPGSGKSLAFMQMLDSARAREHRALVADLGGEFVRRYYREGKDLILNPLDKRTQNWSPFAEMRMGIDGARVAGSIIPEGSAGDKEWNGYARAILEATLERLFDSGQATNEALVGLVMGAGANEMRQFLAGSPAQSFFSEGNERMLGSIRGILSNFIKPLTYLHPQAGRDGFSIRRWIESDGDSWLFITFKKDQLDASSRLIAAQIDSAATAILSMESQLDRRVWFALDEFAQFGEVRQLEALLTQGRKYGVCGILGMQGLSQPSMVYGRERGQAILSGLGSWTVFRQADADSAEYMSKFLGDEEIRRVTHSISKNKDGSSESTGEQIVRQRAVMPGELMQLQQRTAIVNIAGPMPPAMTEIPLPAPSLKGQAQVKPIEENQEFRPMLVKVPPLPGLEEEASAPALPRPGPKPLLPSSRGFDDL